MAAGSNHDTQEVPSVRYCSKPKSLKAKLALRLKSEVTEAYCCCVYLNCLSIQMQSNAWAVNFLSFSETLHL